jgi:rare lipoprotein A
MMTIVSRMPWITSVTLGWVLAMGMAVAAPTRGAAGPLDRSGQTRIGTASFYAERYSGKTMADGTPMRQSSNNAASLTLPLGTTARVTNLETGRSAIIAIRDRGPYVKGRIVDLSAATASQIGISRRKGLARVAVTPITLPETRNTGRSRVAATPLVTRTGAPMRLSH